MATNVLDVYVKLPTGRNAQFDMLPHQDIAFLRSSIAKQEKIPPHAVLVKYQGKILKSSSTMQYLGVRSETILKAEFLEPRNITVKYQLPNETIEETSINIFDTGADLIDKIQKVAGDDISVYRANKKSLIKNNVPICESGIYDGEILVVKEGSLTSSERTDVDVAPSDPIDLTDCFDAEGRNVEVAFSFDTTGSMFSCLDTVRRKLESTCRRLVADIPNIRISLIAHGDYCDQNSSYVIKIQDFTSDVPTLVRFAKDVPASGGGDTPECYEWVLRKAQGLDWSEDSAKALVVIGDCTPHEMGYTDQLIDWHQELDVLVGMGVKIYGVHAFTSSSSKDFYQELADRSGGCYLPFLHFDAITDMFLAVCYREADDNQLGDFVQEVADAGEMTEAKKAIFEQLEKPTDKTEEKKRKQKDYIWWNNSRNVSTESAQYLYDVQEDKWRQNSPKSFFPERFATAVTSPYSRRKKKGWRRILCFRSDEY